MHFFFLSLSVHSIKIVFLHEADHDNFTRAVDEIMNGIESKHTDIEINYRKIPYDRQMDEKLKENGKLKPRKKYFLCKNSSVACL